MFHEDRDKGALPRLKLLSSAINGGFCKRSSGKILGLKGIKRNDNTLGDPSDLLYDRVGKGPGFFPQGPEFFLNPGNPLRRRIFPENFIVLREGAPGFIDRPQKADLAAIEGLDYPRFSVEEDPVFGNDPDLDIAFFEKLIESAVALPVQEGFQFGVRFIPAGF
jgi:hypothetical protein